MIIRPETPADAVAIGDVTSAAFEAAEHRSGTEAAIVAALREAGALAISLVAVEQGRVVGHVAFSPVRIDGAAGDWFGLGPVSVLPDRQRRGTGAALVREGLSRLAALGAAGCVLLGDPGYYRRFGFIVDPALRYADVPPGYLQRLVFSGPDPVGRVEYHPAFEAR